MSPQLTRLSLSCLLLVPCLMACGGSGATPLKDFPPFTLYVNTLSPDYVSVILLPDPTLFQGGCPELLPEARATFNGHRLTVLERGRVNSGLFSSSCAAPMFDLRSKEALPEAREDAISTLEVTDGSRTLHMEIRGVGITRTARLVEPASGPLTAGAEVALTWTPTTDILQASEVTVQLLGGDGAVQELTGKALRVEGNLLRFKMPGMKPGPVTIHVLPGNSGSVVSCNTRCMHSEGLLLIHTELR